MEVLAHLSRSLHLHFGDTLVLAALGMLVAAVVFLVKRARR